MRLETTMNQFDRKTYYYDLPEELIAQNPIEPRDEARLLVYNRRKNSIQHKIFKDVIDMNLTEEYEWDYFFDSSIFFPNENEVVFTNGEEVSSVEELEGLIYVRAKKMYFTFDYKKAKKDPRGGPEVFR